MAVPPEQQIAALEAKVRQYEQIHEDMLAQRVFAKARKQVTAWVTFGGLAAVLVGVIGYTNLQSDLEDGAKDKLHSLADAQVNTIVHQEAVRRITPMVEHERKQLENAGLVEFRRVAESRATRVLGRITPEAESGPALATRPSVNYSTQMLSVRDSGPEGSVVGFAVASALEYQLRARRHETVRLSPRYLYYYARKAGGLDLRTDSGANLADAMTVLKTRGAVAETAWPYEAGEFASSPPPSANRARRYRAQSRQIQGVDRIKSALQQGPVVAGISVYGSFNSDGAARTGEIPDPKPDEEVEGGHAICIVGYDDAQHRFKFENSWGPRWGDDGYGYVSYDYVRKHGSGAWALWL